MEKLKSINIYLLCIIIIIIWVVISITPKRYGFADRTKIVVEIEQYRTCERAELVELGEEIKLFDFSNRLYNKLWKH